MTKDTMEAAGLCGLAGGAILGTPGSPLWVENGVVDDGPRYGVQVEAPFWVLSGAFLVLRYWAGLDRLSVVFLVLIVADNLVILGLGVLDYLYTGRFATYQFAIAAVLLYGITLGKRNFARLDAYLKRRINKRKVR